MCKYDRAERGYSDFEIVSAEAVLRGFQHPRIHKSVPAVFCIVAVDKLLIPAGHKQRYVVFLPVAPRKIQDNKRAFSVVGNALINKYVIGGIIREYPGKAVRAAIALVHRGKAPVHSVQIGDKIFEPRVLGGATGFSSLQMLFSMYAGMRLYGVTGLIIAPILWITGVNFLRTGILDGFFADIRFVVGDIRRRIARPVPVATQEPGPNVHRIEVNSPKPHK